MYLQNNVRFGNLWDLKSKFIKFTNFIIPYSMKFKCKLFLCIYILNGEKFVFQTIHNN